MLPLGTVVAQSVKCQTIDWITGARSPTDVKEFSSRICVQTSSEAHPASNPVDTGGPFPEGKARVTNRRSFVTAVPILSFLYGIK
jgi:hypothetical protein